jgi:hypothetical protein
MRLIVSSSRGRNNTPTPPAPFPFAQCQVSTPNARLGPCPPHFRWSWPFSFFTAPCGDMESKLTRKRTSSTRSFVMPSQQAPWTPSPAICICRFDRKGDGEFSKHAGHDKGLQSGKPVGRLTESGGRQPSERNKEEGTRPGSRCVEDGEPGEVDGWTQAR